MTQATNLLEVLQLARKQIENPQAWIKGHFSKTRTDGQTCYCAQGAVRQALDRSVNKDTPIGRRTFLRTQEEVLKRLEAVMPANRKDMLLAEFNDQFDTQHADILALFDRAIAAASKGGAL